MSIRNFLGFAPASAPTAETEAVRKVIEALDHLPPDQARYIAAFGYLLGRAANADLQITPEETAVMEKILTEQAGIPLEQAMIVVQTAKMRTQFFGGTDNFLVTREFARIATHEQKLNLLDCVFAVTAAGDDISQTENNEIRQIASELGIEHPDFIRVRSAWRDRLTVMRNLPAASEQA
jgi:uncharacterized tellurite resistance protein B-like protein